MSKITEKIKSFFNKIFNNNKQLLDTNIKSETKIENDFKKDLSTENQRVILDIQQKYEEGKVKEEELPMNEIFELVDLYKQQINTLNREIDILRKIKNKG